SIRSKQRAARKACAPPGQHENENGYHYTNLLPAQSARIRSGKPVERGKADEARALQHDADR
ncbi:hypothetical protein, partial [Bacillus cereus group sp. BC60]|uniref:hypothetical protein n=1 Tax=Bacillus cereus group sp. BC60 TaxID=3445283 RepID=UPI003F69C973